MEYDLLHLIVRIDVEHIYFSEAVEGQIEPFCRCTAEKIQPCAACKGTQGIFVSKETKIDKTADDPQQDQKTVPYIGVYGQRSVRVVKAAGVREHGDAAQKGIAHEKGEQDAADERSAEPGVSEQDVHGDAAELEGKIPPVIRPAAQDEGEDILLPDLTAQHKEAAQKEKPVGKFWEIFCSY